MARTLGVGEKESFWCFKCMVVFTEMAADVKGLTEIKCDSCGMIHPIEDIRSRTKQTLDYHDRQAAWELSGRRGRRRRRYS